MTSTKLRAGVVGAGAISRHGHIPALLGAGVEIAGVCDPAPGRAAEVAAEFGIPHALETHEELLGLPDLDLVVIGAPNVFHAPIAIAALESGRHVLCEKPMAATSADGEKMIAAARKAGKLLSVNQHMRFHPTARAIREAVATGQLGDVYFTDVRWMRSAGIPGYGSWFTRKELAGAGALFDIGVHMLDLGLWVLGFPRVERITGRISGYLGEQRVGLGDWGTDRGAAGFDVEDTAVATLSLAGGGTLRLHVAWASFCGDDERVTVLGTKGGADWSPTLYGDQQPLRFFAPEGPDRVVGTPYQFAGERDQWHEGVKGFVRAVRGEEELAVTPEEPLQVLRLLEHVVASSEQNAELPVSTDPAG
ncbi:MAG: Gfo/Idh/MocA family oxidoreductase [Gaiellales bacterium]